MCAHELLEHSELLSREDHRGIAPGHLPPEGVEFDPARPVPPAQCRGEHRGGPATECAKPHDELCEREWLCEIVVGAELEAVDLVLQGRGGGQHEDADARVIALHLTTHLVAVHAGKVAVEHHQVVVVYGEGFEGLFPVGDEVGGEALPPQVGAHSGAQDGMIFNHKDAHALSVRTAVLHPCVLASSGFGRAPPRYCMLDRVFETTHERNTPTVSLRGMFPKFRSASPATFAAATATVVTGVACGLLLLMNGCTASPESGGAGGADHSSGAGESGMVVGPEGDGTVFADTSPADALGDGTVDDPSGIPIDPNHSAIAGLDPALLAAVQGVAEAARADGLEIRVSSGWRSAELQQRLLQDAVSTYGSESEARLWVDTPERSTHVTGQAVDIAGLDEALWVGQHGAQFGLCQTFENERWHFELSDIRPDDTCPAPPYQSAAERPG